MAYLTCTYSSTALERETAFYAVIPDQCKEDIPTVYLLHGLGDNASGWMRLTAAERYARDTGIALIAPSVARSFYTDMADFGPRYFTYVTEELVTYTRQLFRLSEKREKTFIAGNSMGGYGAMKAALTKPEQYGAAASFSGVMDIQEFFDREDMKKDGISIWGKDFREVLQDGDQNLFSLVNGLKQEPQKAPSLYQVCGTEDFLYGANCRFRDFIQPLGFDYQYHEMPGNHTWKFWDSQLADVLEFFINKVKGD